MSSIAVSEDEVLVPVEGVRGSMLVLRAVGVQYNRIGIPLTRSLWAVLSAGAGGLRD